MREEAKTWFYSTGSVMRIISHIYISPATLNGALNAFDLQLKISEPYQTFPAKLSDHIKIQAGHILLPISITRSFFYKHQYFSVQPQTDA